MRLTVLGAGPAYTDRRDSTGACYLVEHHGGHLLLDLGQGSFPRIFPHVRPEAVDAVVVSHLHPDHFIDLVPLRHYLRYHLKPSRRMRVLGPTDLGERLDCLHAQPGFSAEALDLEVLGRDEHRIGAFTVRGGLVAHTEESYAVRVDAGDDRPGLVYSGDCGHADDLAPLARPGDTLLVEVSFGVGPVPPGAMHLDAPAVARVATLTGAGRVLLTHLQMGNDAGATVAAVRSGYDGPVEFVWPGSVIDL
jgi:ribonuclease BN (tRNA processing enzyme)